MLTLYTAARSRGFVCEWMLEEAGLPFAVRRLDVMAGEARTPEHLAIHPLGAVPALRIEDAPLIESLAICLYVADLAPSGGLAPAPDHPDRAALLQWMVYASATLEPALAAPFVRSLAVAPEDWSSVSTAAERDAFARVVAPLAAGLERGHLVGEGFSAADVCVGARLYWADQVGLLASLPAARAYLQTLCRRPAFARAAAHDGGVVPSPTPGSSGRGAASRG